MKFEKRYENGATEELSPSRVLNEHACPRVDVAGNLALLLLGKGLITADEFLEICGADSDTLSSMK